MAITVMTMGAMEPSTLKNGYLNGTKVSPPLKVVKRDGRIVEFESERIAEALRKCFGSLNIEPLTSVEALTERVVNVVAAKYEQPTV